jgi:coenzyme PQQ precursor peptide PqqA
MHRLPRTHAACAHRVRSIAFRVGLRYGSSLNKTPWTRPKKVRKIMAWTTPTLVEICIGLEINGYLPAEF